MILKLYEKTGKTPSGGDFEEEYSVPSQNIEEYFGTWNNAIKSANLEVNQEKSEVTESDEELINMYINFAEEIGRVPRAIDLKKSDDIYNAYVFYVRFGGLRELQKIAGFDASIRGAKKQYSKEEIIKDLSKEYLKKGRRLKNSEVNKNKKLPATSTIISYFNTTKMRVVWEEVEEKINQEAKIIARKSNKRIKGIQS